MRNEYEAWRALEKSRPAQEEKAQPQGLNDYLQFNQRRTKK